MHQAPMWTTMKCVVARVQPPVHRRTRRRPLLAQTLRAGQVRRRVLSVLAEVEGEPRVHSVPRPVGAGPRARSGDQPHRRTVHLAATPLGVQARSNNAVRCFLRVETE
mmetsp:Transcript_3630/g.8496  ORF Transcript_3630/g.8496 Transcript_3630/m.8496 type:complete len:108 (-) Transcript_3630:169-492(-)